MSMEDLKMSKDSEVVLELPVVPWDKNILIFLILHIFKHTPKHLIIK